MNHPLLRLLQKDTKRVVGLMSGTSMDGVDAALVEVSGHGGAASARLLRFHAAPFPGPLRTIIERILAAPEGPVPLSIAEVSAANFELGACFAEAAVEVARGEPIDLVGTHGQTVWHEPPSMAAIGGESARAIGGYRQGPTPSTLQLGEPAVIADRTGTITVGDFRVADLAAGGEGAPLVPYADWALFRKPGTVRALQNIGGIANVSVVGDALSEVQAFDNGPGNMIIDALAVLASGGRERFDRDGTLSAAGTVLPGLLRELLDDEYLRRSPPKSTGRERYGRDFVEEILAIHGAERMVDLLATAVAFTAEAIAESYERFVLPRSPIGEVLVAGGGAHNVTMMAHLARRLAPIPVAPFHEAGVGPDEKEAVSFALLAVEAIHGSAANLPSVTGARGPAILGKICLPPPGA